MQAVNIIVRSLLARFLAAIIIVCMLSPVVYAQTNENWTDVNLAVTDDHVIPAYFTFASAALKLQTAAPAFCSDMNNESLSAFQLSYHQAMDAWEGIQHVQFGPVTYFNWNFRLQYWPDDNGTGGRQLSALVTSQNQSALSSENFSSPATSIGVQGFPALERLLFVEDSLMKMQEDDYRCQVAQAISKNIYTIASGIHQRWQDEFRTTVANANERGFFESAEDATISFLKALVESVPRLQEQKLVPAMGESFVTARERRAESWRSQRSLRNLKINISTLAELFNGSGEVQLSSVLEAADVAVINKIFAEMEVNLAGLPDAMVTALESEEDYLVLQNFITQLEELDDVLETALKNTDLYLGFNSQDGD